MKLTDLFETVQPIQLIQPIWYHVTTKEKWAQIQKSGYLAGQIQLYNNDLTPKPSITTRNWLTAIPNQYGAWGDVCLSIRLPYDPNTGLPKTTWPAKWTPKQIEKLKSGTFKEVVYDHPIPLEWIVGVKYT